MPMRQGSLSALSDGSETQAPEEQEQERRQEQVPVSVPMPQPPAHGRRQRHTPEARSSSHVSGGATVGKDYTTPPVPGSAAQ